MHLQYDEDLVEAAVFLCASGRHPGVPTLQIARFHRAREKAYSILDPDERNAAFFQLHLDWFREWGLEKLLTDRLKEFPLLHGALKLLAFRKARSKNEEGAELYVNADSGAGIPPALDRRNACPALRHGVVALRSERFESDEDLARFLRHELTHLHDMVDPAFGYSPDLASSGFNTVQQRLTRERYRLLWDLTIDGRLSAHGHLPDDVHERHETHFHRAYSFWTEEQRRAVFDELWTDPAPRHARLLALAADPKALSQAHQPLPGAACPLCGFPTFDWADPASLGASARRRIASEFPHWTPEQGTCGRCAEIYHVLAKANWPANLSV